ncbi:MAG: DUF4190 domain-containing protein [Acidobacteria bacterium]|nr:DUF4190 domain-containing protein [Acidobacteriota bacterium]
MTYQPEQEPQPNSGGATPAENQPGFGEAPYSQSPSGEAPFGQTPGDQQQPSFGEAPYSAPAQQPYGQQFNQPGQQPYGQQPFGQQGQQYGQPGYGQVPYGQVPYGQQGYAGAPVSAGSKGLSIASMVVGIVSLLGLGFFIIPSIGGIVLGHLGMVKEKPQGKVFSLVGLITSYLALVIYGLVWIGIIVAAVSVRNHPYSNY